jgi:hypothetical protein
MCKEAGGDATDWEKLQNICLHQELPVKAGEMCSQIS